MHHQPRPHHRLGALRRAAGILLVGAALLPTGCIRQTAKSATEGALEAMAGGAVTDDQTGDRKGAAGGAGTSGEKQQLTGQGPGARGGPSGAGSGGPSGAGKGDGASANGGGKGLIQPVARDAVSGTLTALDGEMAPLRRVSRATATEVTSGVVQGAYGQREEVAALVADASSAAGQAIVRAVAEELRRQAAEGMGLDANEVGDGAAMLARRTASAAVAGATEQLALDLSTCPPEGPCLAVGIQRASRAVAMGLAEGVSRKTSPWELLIPFALGAALATGIAVIVAVVRKRRQAVLVAAGPGAVAVPVNNAPIRTVRHVPRFRPHAPEATS
ncbi:hypothetical protein [Chondromyces crocatus]|uniref:Uncharacterized protein n=1 Tax=Chondromyces crocatus TaxID=52 RepID=A0A0K1EU12_CHOCO|nr:hypothetical protein [Chondromyces crocatus]AKT44108.1 uncharacterized protein CMC5_083480 [Chondromyces crocatus]